MEFLLQVSKKSTVRICMCETFSNWWTGEILPDQTTETNIISEGESNVSLFYPGPNTWSLAANPQMDPFSREGVKCYRRGVWREGTEHFGRGAQHDDQSLWLLNNDLEPGLYDTSALTLHHCFSWLTQALRSDHLTRGFLYGRALNPTP